MNFFFLACCRSVAVYSPSANPGDVFPVCPDTQASFSDNAVRLSHQFVNLFAVPIFVSGRRFHVSVKPVSHLVSLVSHGLVRLSRFSIRSSFLAFSPGRAGKSTTPELFSNHPCGLVGLASRRLFCNGRRVSRRATSTFPPHRARRSNRYLLFLLASAASPESGIFSGLEHANAASVHRGP